MRGKYTEVNQAHVEQIHCRNVQPVRIEELNSLNEPPRPILKKDLRFIQLLTNGNNEIRPNTSGTRRFMSHVNIVEEKVRSNCEDPMKKKAEKRRKKEMPMMSAAEGIERRRKVQESTDRARRTFMNQRLEVLRQREKGERLRAGSRGSLS